MNNLIPIVLKRKVFKVGNSHCITIPPEWFKAHKLDPDDLQLVLVADKDIRIVNPEHETEVYDGVTKIAREVKV